GQGQALSLQCRDNPCGCPPNQLTMEITKIKKGKKRYNIYIDGEFSIAVSGETLLKMDLYERKEVRDRDLEKIRGFEDRLRAKEYALNLLSYRPRTKRELIRRLRERKFASDIAEDAVSLLEGSGLVNDYDFVRYYLETFKEKRGAYRLKNELFRLGVDENIIDSVLDEMPIDEGETARGLIDKWLRVHRTRDEKTKKRLIDYLIRRGISWDTISDLNDYIKTSLM
ncbi:RecX family transcriptional regulator, partial [candidate division WOR-3 bacterium]|nr:RecX family transcriptional regulator [candidate division WOR-3 bacterium]